MNQIIIKDISEDLKKVLPEFDNYKCIVIISKYNTGKTTSATDIIFNHFGSSDVRYITLIDQSKPSVKPRKSDFNFGEIPKNKTIIFDELSDDKQRDINSYVKELIKHNKVIILTNPYGSSNNPEKEINLFKEQEAGILPQDTLFIYVTNLI